MRVHSTPSPTNNKPSTQAASLLKNTVFTLLLLAAPLCGFGEDLVVHGLTLRGVNARAVEGDTVRLSKGSIEKLVPVGTFKSVGVELAFADDSFKHSLADDVVVKFVKDAVAESDVTSVFAGIVELLARGSTSTEDVLFYVCKSPIASDVVALLKARYGDRSAVVAAACVVTPTACLTLTKPSAREVKTILEERAGQYLRRRDRVLLQTLLPALKIFSPEFASDIEKFLLELTAITTENTSDIASILTGMAQFLNGDSLLARSGYVLFTDAVHSIAARKITEGHDGEALGILSFVSQQWKTEKTAELTARALELLSNEAIPPFSVERADFLRGMSEADSEVRRAYKSYLEFVLSQTLKQNQKGIYTSYFKEYLNLNPDPSTKNDAFRFELAKLYLSEGHVDAARQEVSQMRTGIGLFDRMRLLVSGYYFRSGWVFFSLFAAVIGGFLIYLREKKERGIKAKRAQRELKDKMASGRTPSAEHKTVKQQTPTFRSMARMSEYQAPSDPRLIELVGLLARLGLSPGATEKEVKQAFRQVAKSVHPDMAQVGDAKASDEFIEITRAYERSLEIIAELNGEIVPESSDPS